MNNITIKILKTHIPAFDTKRPQSHSFVEMLENIERYEETPRTKFFNMIRERIFPLSRQSWIIPRK